MFCKGCGKEIPNNIVNCPNCGTSCNNQVDTGNVGWFFLGCCIPIAGLILYFIWKDEKPNSAKKCIIGFLVGIISIILLYIVYIFLIASIIAIGTGL